MSKEKLESIRELLSLEYQCEMTEREINGFASDLYSSVFGCEFDLADIVPIINGYEERAKIENTRWYYVFCGIIDLLDNGERTAERLYESFMHSMELLHTFVKLYFENDRYISREKLEKAKQKALSIFDKEVLKVYNITE